MDYKFFLLGIKNIILNPVKAWEIIDSENRQTRKLRNNFFIPLIILVSGAAFTGSLFYYNIELPPVYSIFIAVKCFILMFITIYATAFMFGEVTYPLDLGKEFSISFRIIVYSSVPFFICQIFSRVFESLLFINVIALYGLYIFWTGIEKMLTPPQHKKMPLLIATTIIMVGIYIAANFVLTKLIDRVYYSFFG
jgi:hypothetical protein